nr:unnamed protein product [Callosobruchus analis]
MPSKQSREEILKKKREAERARLLRIKSDPIKLAEYKEKERQKYLKKIEKGQRKTINQMTDREKRSTRRKWREYSSSYRQKQAVAKNTENYIHETTPPLSDNEAHRENIPPLSDNEAQQEAKRRSYKQRKLRNKQIKQKDAMISLLKKKIKAQRQKYKRLREKTAQAKKVQVSPKTRIENMAKNPEHHKEVVKKAIFEMYPNVTRFTWNYHEAGHGKGAPDGVGATCKRMADDVIARGGDISDIKKFAAVVRERCPSIRVSVIEEEEIDQINSND